MVLYASICWAMHTLLCWSSAIVRGFEERGYGKKSLELSTSSYNVADLPTIGQIFLIYTIFSAELKLKQRWQMLRFLSGSST